MRNDKQIAIGGWVDGLIACMALVLGLALTPHTRAHVVWHGALALFVAEGLGMAAMEFFSDSATGLRGSLIMGVATGIPILAIGAPWTVAGGAAALMASIVVAVVLAGILAIERGGGAKGWVQTFAVLGAVSIVAALSSAI